jgi:hypothetical protein
MPVIHAFAIDGASLSPPAGLPTPFRDEGPCPEASVAPAPLSSAWQLAGLAPSLDTQDGTTSPAA